MRLWCPVGSVHVLSVPSAKAHHSTARQQLHSLTHFTFYIRPLWFQLHYRADIGILLDFFKNTLKPHLRPLEGAMFYKCYGYPKQIWPHVFGNAMASLLVWWIRVRVGWDWWVIADVNMHHHVSDATHLEDELWRSWVMSGWDNPAKMYY